MNGSGCLAQQHGLTVTAVRRLVDMEEVIAQLQKTTFRCTPEMYERARQRAREEMGNSTYPRT